jgi:NitT/TauT family transport system substrate-binding protein
VVPQDSDIKSIPDLKGKRLGIAGGPVDKSWLLLQALALQTYDLDLKQAVTPVFAAPPLLNQQIKQGRIDAVLNFWPYVARLEAIGMHSLIGVQDVTEALGIQSEVPFVGYVFNEAWAAKNQDTILGFIQATTKAKAIMKDSDEEWQRLRPQMKAADDRTFTALRDGFRGGIPKHWGSEERRDAEKLFDILHALGGRKLVGDTNRLSEGTFWPAIHY